MRIVSFVVALSTAHLPGAAAATGQAVDQAIAALPPGKTVVVRFRATVNSPFPINATQVSLQGAVTGANIATVLTDDPDSPGTSDPTLTPITAAPDLAIAKSHGSSFVAAGQTVTYALDVRNIGTQGATGVMVSETVPADTTFDAGASTAGWSCADGSAAGTHCTLALGAVPVSAIPIPLAFVVHVVASPAGATLDNTASVSDDGLNGPDLDPTNNSATDSAPLGPAADLAITKTNGRTALIKGTTTVYTITVANNGPAAVVGATVADTLPPRPDRRDLDVRALRRRHLQCDRQREHP